MSSPENRGGEPETWLKEYGDKRTAEKARLRKLHPGITEKELTAATWDILPPFFKPEAAASSYVEGAAGDAYRFDVEDTEGRKPTPEEAEREVEAFHEQEVESRLRRIVDEHGTNSPTLPEETSQG